MLTSAIFFRVASFGIPTAQPLKRGIGRSLTAVARSRPLLQSKGKSSVSFADGVLKDGFNTQTVSLSSKNFARPFHASAVYRTYCDSYDLGLPCTDDDMEGCDCYEDDGIGWEPKPICEICNINPTAHELISNGGFHASYCQECAEMRWEAEKRWEEEKRRQMEAKAKIAAAHRERVNKMLEYVKSLPPGEQVPIAYAVRKVSSIWGCYSAALRHRDLRDLLSEELQIVKVRNRWKCDKGRVDAMDFKLWDGQVP